MGNHEAAHLDTINLLVSVLSSGSMLDIGCGMGRITGAAAGKIKELVALEPDVDRCNWTRAVVADFEGVTVLNVLSQEYISQNPGKQFDLVVLSMILQHQSTHNCLRLMDDLATLTKSGGIAIVSSTHALERAKCFTYQDVSQARISEEEFNHYADNSHIQDKGLPVRRFSRAEFEALVPESFDIIQWTQFSYYRPEFLDRFAEIHRVDAQELTKIGNSQFMVLKKKNT